MVARLVLGISLAALAVAEDGGWKVLFDGKSLNGWETHWANNWKAQDGALVCDASERSWLSTTASFSDYILKLEFRGAAKVNSGVFLRSQKEGQPHITGYELQIWDYQPAGYNTGNLVGPSKRRPSRLSPTNGTATRSPPKAIIS